MMMDLEELIVVKENINIISKCRVTQEYFNISECKKNNCLGFIDFIKGNITCEHKVFLSKKEIGFNVTPTAFLNDIKYHLLGSSTPTLDITHISLGTAFDKPDKSSTISDSNEIARVLTDSEADSGDKIVIESIFLPDDVTLLSTTVAGSPSPTTTTFDVASSTGLVNNDMLQITLSGAENRKEKRKISISGTSVTLTDALPSVPVAGDVVKQLISRVLVIYNGTATLGTGDPLSILPIDGTEMPATDALKLTHEIFII